MESSDQHEITPATGPEPVPSPPPDGPGLSSARVERLERQYQTLETLFALTVSALILLSLGLNLFLFKQGRVARGQVAQQAPIVQRAVTEFRKTREPVVRALINSLENFSLEDQQFQSIMEKYRPYLGQYFVVLQRGFTGTNAAPLPSLGTNR